MAGGIFADQPFVVNPKCVVISIILMILYWMLPYRNPFMLPVIFLVGYVAIAWYDYLYNCDLKMYSGSSPVASAIFNDWGKPQRRFDKPEPNAPKLVDKQELAYKKKVYLFHALLIAPFLFYVGWYGKKANKNIWSVVGSVAFVTILYHGLRLIYPRQVTSCKKANEEERLSLFVIYLLHLLVVAPLLVYIAYKGGSADKRVWGPLLGLAIIVFIYHGIRYFFPREIEENCQETNL